MQEEDPFKVPIAGGSVVGLLLANALEKAGIDFLVLEKGAIAPRLGASISVLCQSSRVLEQLGILKKIQDCTVPLRDRHHFDETGRLFEDSQVLNLIAEQTGRPFLFMERHKYIEILRKNLMDNTRVRDHVGVVSYKEDASGVTVTTDKGEEIRGSILVGADGVHSPVRQLIANSIASKDINRAKSMNEGELDRPDTVCFDHFSMVGV